MPNNNRTLVSAAEQSQIERTLLQLFNTYEDLPVRRVDYEFLNASSGMCLSTVQAAYKQRQYILGGYKVAYHFRIIYRVIAQNVDERLYADELLNEMGDWAETQENTELSNWKLRREDGASVIARDENSVEDHAINFILTYEVNV